jgi:hypothetical protein
MSPNASLDDDSSMPPIPPGNTHSGFYDAENEEQIVKFLIGLRLLGEKKKARYLAYLRQLIENQHHPEGEKENGHGI